VGQKEVKKQRLKVLVKKKVLKLLRVSQMQWLVNGRRFSQLAPNVKVLLSGGD
jgi:hypothetical protein